MRESEWVKRVTRFRCCGGDGGRTAREVKCERDEERRVKGKCEEDCNRQANEG